MTGDRVTETAVIHLSNPERGPSYCGEPVTLIKAPGDTRPVCQKCHRGAMKSVRTVSRDALARALYLEQARAHQHPDDPTTPERRWDENFEFKSMWFHKADSLIDEAGLPIAVSAELEGARAKLAAAYPLIRDMTDPDECWFDHHGGCQAHGYLSLQPGEKCPHAEAKEWLAETRAALHPNQGGETNGGGR